MSEEILTSTPPAPSSTFTTREQVEAKLLHHLELTFGHPFQSRDPLAAARTNGTSSHLASIIAAHFHLPRQVATDCITSSITLGDLVSRISEMLHVPATDLF